MARKIENDEQYMKAAQYLIDIAEMEEDPLDDRSPEQKQKDMAVFDRTADLMQQYRRAELAQMFPGLRKIYADLGWTVGDAPAAATKPDEVPLPAEDEQPTPEPELPREEPTVDLGDWLDDE